MPTVPGATRKVAGQFFDFGALSYHTRHPNSGLILDSIADDHDAFNLLVNHTMQPAGGTVDIAGVLRLGKNLTIPSNVCLRFAPGAILAPDVGVIVTHRGGMSAGSHSKRFGGGGSVIFLGGQISKFYPQWWGAKGDGVSDDSASFQSAHDALPANGGEIVLPVPSDSYSLMRAVNITKRSRWVGKGGKLAVPIKCGSANDAFTARLRGGYLEFDNLNIQGASGTGTNGSAFNLSGASSEEKLSFLRITNCYLKDFSAPVVLRQIDHGYFSDVFYYQSVFGLTTSSVWSLAFCVGMDFRRVTTSGSGRPLPSASITIGSNSDTISLNNCEFYHAGGIVLNNLETGASFAPRYVKIDSTNVEVGMPTDNLNDSAFNIHACQDLRIANSTALSARCGVRITGGKHISIIGGSVYANSEHGIVVGSAARGVGLVGVHVYDNSIAKDNAFSGILVEDASNDFSIIACSIESNVQHSSGFKHRFHISIGKDSSNFVVADNRLPKPAGTSALNLGVGLTAHGFRNNQIRESATTGSFTASRGTATVVPNRCVHSYAVVNVVPRNESASALSRLFISNKTSEASFTLSHDTASGSEIFDYVIQ